MVVDLDGQVVGAQGAFARAVSMLPFAGEAARHGSVMVVDGMTWRTTIVPILAPTEIGWVVFAVKLDNAEMRGLERLSAIPLTATILHRTRMGHWASGAGRCPRAARPTRWLPPLRAAGWWHDYRFLPATRSLPSSRYTTPAPRACRP
ncbi:hypothetical protein AB5I41_10515 [Sphingomonas sp. MMS24-JH45]